MTCPNCNAEMYRNKVELWNNKGEAIEVEVWYCGCCGRIEGAKI